MFPPIPELATFAMRYTGSFFISTTPTGVGAGNPAGTGASTLGLKVRITNASNRAVRRVSACLATFSILEISFVAFESRSLTIMLSLPDARILSDAAFSKSSLCLGSLILLASSIALRRFAA